MLRRQVPVSLGQRWRVQVEEEINEAHVSKHFLFYLIRFSTKRIQTFPAKNVS